MVLLNHVPTKARRPSPSPSDLLCGHRATSRAWAVRSRLLLYSPFVRSGCARDATSFVSSRDRALREDESRRRLERIRVSRFDYLYPAQFTRLTARFSRSERGVTSLFDRGVVVVRWGRRAATHDASGDVTTQPWAPRFFVRSAGRSLRGRRMRKSRERL